MMASLWGMHEICVDCQASDSVGAIEILEMRYLWETPHGLDGKALARWLPSFRATPLPAALRASLDDLGAAPALAAARL